MGDWSKKPPVPPPQPKAKSRTSQAVAHVVAKSVTKIEVDGLPVTVEQTGERIRWSLLRKRRRRTGGR